MGQLSQGRMREQESAFGGAVSEASPLHDIYYVDSVSGADGNDGLSRRHPKATLSNALAAASAGDTIVCHPGGSETLTATLAVSLAGIKIVCPTHNPQSGYELTGAGTVDLMTVSAANVFVRGLKFTRTAGAGSTTAGILATAAADGLHVKSCLFDYSALTSAWTNYGIELTDDIVGVRVEGCRYKDCHRGVLGAIATGKDAKDWVLRDCEFWVGRATAFGVFCQPAGTGTLQGISMIDCHFIEANGDGSAATDAWDGTNGADAGSGPINFNASVDRWSTVRCTAYTAANTLWENQQAINAGAAGHHIEGFTHQGAALADVSSDTTVIESRIIKVHSDTVVLESDSTKIESSIQVAESNTVVLESDSIKIESSVQVAESNTVVLESDSIKIESSVQVAESNTVVLESDSIRIESHVVVLKSDSIIVESSIQVAESNTVVLESDSIKIESSVQVAESNTVVLESDSIRIESHVVVLKSDSIVISSDTAVIETWSKRGNVVGKIIVIADNAIPNNSQAAGGLLATATGGACLIENVVVSKDGTAFAGPLNLEITSNNVYGDTGADDPHAADATADLGGGAWLDLKTVGDTKKFPFPLESGKGLYAHGDGAAGTSAGNLQFAIYGYALADGAYLL